MSYFWMQNPSIGKNQVVINHLLTLTTGLAGDMRQVKIDIRELKANARKTDASIDEILRLLRERNN